MKIIPLRFCCFLVCICPALAQFQPNNLVVSRSVYQGTASTVTIGQKLPPVCPATATCPAQGASDNGAFPAIGLINPSTGLLQNVWNNDNVDSSFGVTSPIFLDQMTTGGSVLTTVSISPTQIVTSFSSKSELALNLSTDGTTITFAGYTLGASNTTSLINNLDVSNSNTPGVVDVTNPVGTAFYRGVAAINSQGTLTSVTTSNAYSGNNGRAAILANGLYYMVGNDDNGSPNAATLNNLVLATGSQIVVPGQNASPATPGTIKTGSFSVTQEGDTADKAGKDDNYRGLTIFNNTLYVSKGSGSNGIDTVYQVGSAGSLPTVAGSIPNPPGTAAGYPINILPGFPTALAKTAGKFNIYPFGLWFANANTLYVADEGDGVIADAASSPYAGLQKWVLSNGTWSLAYVMQKGLNLGVPYSVPNYPTSLDPSPAGLRNITGRVNGDGTVTIWAITSTVSSNGDGGADPNQLVTITDFLDNTNSAAAASEQFTQLRTAGYAEVLRGVAFTPGSTTVAPPSYPVTVSGFLYSRVSGAYMATVTVVNNTSAAVNGPLSVQFSGLAPGLTLVSANPLNVLASGQSLAPGALASAIVTVKDPGNSAITFQTSVVNQ